MTLSYDAEKYVRYYPLLVGLDCTFAVWHLAIWDR